MLKAPTYLKASYCANCNLTMQNRTDCRGRCSAVNLLINNTHPNIQGLNGCLNSLCTRGYDSLPYADADVIGIGVFASYIMQCMFVVIIWFGLAAFYLYKQRHPVRYSQHQSQPLSQPEKSTTTDPHASHSQPPQPAVQRKGHQAVFVDFLVQFHKAQCYFSSTLQIASLSYGIFDTDMLVTFSLIPIATNGVLPVVFAFVLLFYHNRSTMDITILTVCTWALASLVYWILYSHVVPINQDFTGDGERYRAYQQFMYKLTALDACGGYSALAVCPRNFELGKRDISGASHNLRAMTPIIWSFSSICLVAILLGKVIKWRRGRPRKSSSGQSKYRQVKSGSDAEAETDAEADVHTSSETIQTPNPPLFRTHRAASIAYWITTICFLAGIGMQLSLLSIGTSLNMMDRSNWSFGQIVAVTIWAEPLLGYLYDEVKELLWSRFNIGNVPK
ncbi:hypothetical protein BDV96DRAFT_195126 [Lophiotrema nucula]|uniref:Uncharacterized protein n=1 Tax=Lophiotrema nucula TaxID=690887 RepID=A0A6A5YTR8_9PLEO|nr:hypothetical protein BDV96DRAFT_195126 [Lophiotrema nucula]